VADWPATREELVAEQEALGQATPDPWLPPDRPLEVGGCFVCFPRGVSGAGRAGDPGWAAAVVTLGGRVVSQGVVTGSAGAAYQPGLLALREAKLLEDAVRAAGETPDVLLVDATGRDHPRRAGFALQLGFVLGIPTVGVTHRMLVARGEWPSDEQGACSPLKLEGEIVGHWVRTRAGTRPLAVHAGWRTAPDTAVAVVLASLSGRRTPEPLRLARTLARKARTTAAGSAA
jgi:deoxyribonuclease V